MASQTFMERFQPILKFTLILAAYGFTFATIIQFALWLGDTTTTGSSEFQGYYQSYSVSDWLYNLANFELDNTYLADVGLNLLLMSVFVLQHTLLSTSFLQNTKLWSTLHIYGADKPLYIFMTGVTLQALRYFWKPIPIEVWTFEPVTDYFKWVHIFGWSMLYGTSIMLDLPDMIGLTQVAIYSPTITAKSPDLQLMYKRQRHMGLIPFLLIFGIYPYMSLDRFLLGLVLLCYTFLQCRSDTCYEYTKSMKKVKKFRVD